MSYESQDLLNRSFEGWFNQIVLPYMFVVRESRNIPIWSIVPPFN